MAGATPRYVTLKAPDFRLNDHNGQAFRLSEAGEGRWIVLAFYPKAATPG